MLIASGACFLISGNQASPEPNSYQVGPTDKLAVRWMEIDTEHEAEVEVDQNGTISLPLCGRVAVEGLGVAGIEGRLRECFQRYFVEPQLTVSMVEYHSQPISVLGSVTNAGVYYLRSPVTIREALAMAGGLRPEAGSTVIVHRNQFRGGADKGTQTANPEDNAGTSIQLSMDEVMGSASGTAFTVEANDSIVVPRAEIVYVLGEVRRPGGFPLNRSGRMSVLEALALAEGMTGTAKISDCRVLRWDQGAQKRREETVNVKRIIDKRENDVALMPSDVLYIPGSTKKKVAAKVLDTTLQTLSGVVIWRYPH